MKTLSLQERYAPHNACFGCGPANAKGLKICSFPQEDGEVIAEFMPEKYHEAFPNVLNGGIIGTLLDCHSNWTAAWHLMNQSHAERPPCTVTAEYSIKLLRPTPTDSSVTLKAQVAQSTEASAVIHAQLLVDGKICASCEGKFVVVRPGHPAYHRW